VISVDNAGNRGATALTRTVLEAQSANSTPVLVNIDVPQTITGNAVATFPTTVVDTISTPVSAGGVGDIVSSTVSANYVNGGGPGISLQYPATAGPGTAFDNVLTKGPIAATPSIANFIKNLQPGTLVRLARRLRRTTSPVSPSPLRILATSAR